MTIREQQEKGSTKCSADMRRSVISPQDVTDRRSSATSELSTRETGTGYSTARRSGDLSIRLRYFVAG